MRVGAARAVGYTILNYRYLPVQIRHGASCDKTRHAESRVVELVEFPDFWEI